MEKEKRFKIDWMLFGKGILILILCFLVLGKIFKNTGINEQQQLEINILKEQWYSLATNMDLENVKSQQTGLSLALWMASLYEHNQTAYIRIGEWYEKGLIWCLNFDDATFVQELPKDEERYPAQILLLKYEDMDPAIKDESKRNRYIAVYRTGKIRCFYDIYNASETETACVEFCKTGG